MRVAIVGQQLARGASGGIGTYIMGLLRALGSLTQSKEPDVTLFGSVPRGSQPQGEWDWVRPKALGQRIEPRLVVPAWDLGLGGVPAGFDVVHAPSLALPPTKAPAVVVVNDIAWRKVPDTFPRRGRLWHDMALSRALRKAAAFVVPSEESAADLIGAGASRSAVRVIEYGVDHLAPADDAGAEKLLVSLGVTGPFVLSVGTLEPRKNLRLLSEAWRLARSSLGEEWRLVVIGPRGWGDGLEPGQGMVQGGMVSPEILTSLYHKASMLAYVPLLEGYGLPPLEAMACSTPVVASPMPSTRGAALEVDPHSVHSVTEGIVALATDAATREHFVALGRSRVHSLTWEATARHHLELWREVAR